MLKNVAFILVGGLLAIGGFMAGRLSAPSQIVFLSDPKPTFLHVQNTQPAPVRPNNDARELIPLDPQQGKQPQSGQKPQDCPVQIYQGGKLYTFPQPGQQPQQPKQNGNQPGASGQPQEIVPLQPSVPSTPKPSTPVPAQPRSVPIQPSQPTPNTTPSTPNEEPVNPFAPTLPNTRS